MDFERGVFLNCPFDDEYLPLLRPILFFILDLGLQPRIALERLDSGRPRIEKIISLIRESKYGIHDLSRLKAKEAGEYYRLNMPFELGLDVGCRLFRADRWARKKCLILEAERYRYQAALSDMSNSDIAVHANDPVEASLQVRNWLANEAELRAPGAEPALGPFHRFHGGKLHGIAGKRLLGPRHRKATDPRIDDRHASLDRAKHAPQLIHAPGADGSVNFRRDVYGRDEILAAALLSPVAG